MWKLGSLKKFTFWGMAFCKRLHLTGTYSSNQAKGGRKVSGKTDHVSIACVHFCYRLILTVSGRHCGILAKHRLNLVFHMYSSAVLWGKRNYIWRWSIWEKNDGMSAGSSVLVQAPCLNCAAASFHWSAVVNLKVFCAAARRKIRWSEGKWNTGMAK